MNSIRFAVIVLGVVPALLVLTVQGFPVEQSRSRLYRDTESMAAEGNSTVARPVLGGIETLERFQVSLFVYFVLLFIYIYTCFVFDLVHMSNDRV